MIINALLILIDIFFFIIILKNIYEIHEFINKTYRNLFDKDISFDNFDRKYLNKGNLYEYVKEFYLLFFDKKKKKYITIYPNNTWDKVKYYDESNVDIDIKDSTDRIYYEVSNINVLKDDAYDNDYFDRDNDTIYKITGYDNRVGYVVIKHPTKNFRTITKLMILEDVHMDKYLYISYYSDKPELSLDEIHNIIKNIWI